MARTPRFYDPRRIGTLFYPDVARIAREAEEARLAPASGDRVKVLLLVIDMQVDFCHEQGALYVPGAEQDVRRLVEFIYRNAERLTSITCSLDSHYPFQIFHPAWWTDGEGRHPEPFTIVSVEDVAAERWRPAREPEWSLAYVRRLEEEAKKQLCIWPYHVSLGGLGHALDPELWSAVFWHSVARDSQPGWWSKGSQPRTEHYSILRPEISVAGDPFGDLDRDFIAALDEYDHIVIAGEAETHCVLETVEDLVEVFRDAPEKLARIHILRDCMSPVRHPTIDFHAIALERFREFEKRGARLVRSVDTVPLVRDE